MMTNVKVRPSSKIEGGNSRHREVVNGGHHRMIFDTTILVITVVVVYVLFSSGSRPQSSDGYDEEEITRIVKNYFLETYLNESWWSPEHYVWMIDSLLIPYLGIHEEFPWSTENITVEVYPETFEATNIELETRNIVKLDL